MPMCNGKPPEQIRSSFADINVIVVGIFPPEK
jgi:hypothetical protein